VDDLRAAALARANRTVNDGLVRLSLQRNAPGLEDALRSRAQRGQQLAANQRPLDFLAAVSDWIQRLKQPNSSGTELSARLAAAAQAEAIRFDADPLLAHDLRLASRAAAAIAQQVSAARDAERGRPKGREENIAKLYEPLARYQDAVAALFGDRSHIADAGRP